MSDRVSLRDIVAFTVRSKRPAGSEPKFLRILVAERANTWRNEIQDVLAHEERGVEITESGEEVLGALTEEINPPDAVILGRELTSMSSTDVLSRAGERLRERRDRNERTPKIFLLTDIRGDVEMMDMLRSRGVTDFLYPDDDPRKAAAKVLNCLHAEKRAYPRFDVHVPIDLRLGDRKISGTTEDVSMGGVQIVVPARRVQVPPAVGESLTIEIHWGARVHCPAVVRRIRRRVRFLGDQFVVGLQFTELDLAAREAVAALIAQEMQPPVSPM